MEEPYTIVTETRKCYNKNYGDTRICDCGHVYYRHFDPYESMENVGCKYCACCHFQERENKAILILQELDYDPGLLNDWGDGNVDWWHNYIRCLVTDCNNYWRDILENYVEK